MAVSPNASPNPLRENPISPYSTPSPFRINPISPYSSPAPRIGIGRGRRPWIPRFRHRFYPKRWRFRRKPYGYRRYFRARRWHGKKRYYRRSR
jgi:hypothetical protein